MHTGWKIEYIFDHSLPWINEVAQSLARLNNPNATPGEVETEEEREERKEQIREQTLKEYREGK